MSCNMGCRGCAKARHDELVSERTSERGRIIAIIDAMYGVKGAPTFIDRIELKRRINES